MQSTDFPLISIITVTYNAAGRLGRTLQSITAQSFGDYESIIIDGASSDNTAEIAKSFPTDRIKFFSEPDEGIYDAMNKGLGRARGRYVMFLNAGDCFHSPDTLQEIADTITRNNFPGIVYGQTDIVDETGVKIADRHLIAPAVLTLDSFKQGMVVCHQAFVVQRDLAQEYNLNYRYSADYDWCIRCLQNSTSNIYIDDTLVDYLNEGETTANRNASLVERFHIMRYYYGTIPTIWRHLTFIPRFVKRRTQSRGAVIS